MSSSNGSPSSSKRVQREVLPIPDQAYAGFIAYEFAYDGGGLAKGGTVTLYIDGKAVGDGRLNETVPMVFSADETSDVGVKRGSPMTPDMPPKESAFNGTVQVVVIETSGGGVDHLLNREEVLNMIMARQ